MIEIPGLRSTFRGRVRPLTPSSCGVKGTDKSVESPCDKIIPDGSRSHLLTLPRRGGHLGCRSAGTLRHVTADRPAVVCSPFDWRAKEADARPKRVARVNSLLMRGRSRTVTGSRDPGASPN